MKNSSKLSTPSILGYLASIIGSAGIIWIDLFVEGPTIGIKLFTGIGGMILILISFYGLIVRRNIMLLPTMVRMAMLVILTLMWFELIGIVLGYLALQVVGGSNWTF